MPEGTVLDGKASESGSPAPRRAALLEGKVHVVAGFSFSTGCSAFEGGWNRAHGGTKQFLIAFFFLDFMSQHDFFVFIFPIFSTVMAFSQSCIPWLLACIRWRSRVCGPGICGCQCS